jgi:isoquinoline 1-oxidoreductase subunit beta
LAREDTEALDGGITVNPDLVCAQIKGGVIWALGAAARGKVVLGVGGQIITQNFDRYPDMRMQSVPRIDVLLIEVGRAADGGRRGQRPHRRTSPDQRHRRNRIRLLPITKTIRVF